MSELAKQYETSYFQRTSLSAVDSFDTISAEQVAPEYPDQPDVQLPTAPKKLPLNPLNQALVIFFVLVCLGFVAANLVIQYQVATTQATIQNYEGQTAQLKKETDIMMNQLAQQFDYQVIKDAAQKQNMTINKDQVKEVAE
ncbi:hypothetical protein [Vaginisenegalia massiliensis]|uniref:hypothetical protein n=1 Tax=Vaginisenegalia massiliensis TaxID=2058294 RepID=UPI000F5345E2|nr:hypothetical protein [Vaginisenegalia massiliensis]